MRRAFDLLAAVLLGIALAFLLMPLLAMFLRVPPAVLIDQLDGKIALDALAVSIKTGLIAHVVILGAGTPIAYFLARHAFRGRQVVVALIELPLVLPPAVAGIALLVAFGRRGLLGGVLEVLGLEIAFSQAAVVLAVLFVASPFYLRQAIAAFEAVDDDLLHAARTLGAGPWRTFRTVALPLAAGGLGAGSALAWARGLGEFGATIMFAGSFEGTTQTMPLAIYAQLGRDLEVALAIGALLVLVSAAVLVAVKLFPSWRSSVSTYTFRSGRSG